MTAYYNEHDPHAAAWLRNLIAEGHIAPGDVDERSILDVRPADLAGFKQCHFFAGIGVWSYALRQAGWDDSREIWTGSCPCQPFSAAGKGDGFADERHLWPAFFWLIEQCRPARIMGEQVASKDGLAWLDLVLSDLEGADYAAGAVDLGAAGVGAPHIRQRLWWMADAHGQRSEHPQQCAGGQRPSKRHIDERHGPSDLLADAGCEWLRGRHERRQPAGTSGEVRGEVREQRVRPDDGGRGATVLLVDAAVAGRQGLADGRGTLHAQRAAVERTSGDAGGVADASGDGFQGAKPVDPANRGRRSADEGGAPSQPGRPGPTNGFWRDADWLRCRDGKWRPVESRTAPLAHGIIGRVGKLRAYGNAICAPAAVEVIAAMMDVLP